jgi:membrane-bound lytic murein transglycosylase B
MSALTFRVPRDCGRLASILVIGCFALSIPYANASVASYFEHNPEVKTFIEQLVARHQFDRRELRRLFRQARIQTGILRVMSRPSTALPWYQYRASQLTEARIQGGVEYWQSHADTLARASAEYGVPQEIIVATIGIETFYGRNTGTSRVFDALATLAFAYPPRAELFRGELEQFLLLARESNLDAKLSKGSYAGALGIAQFLPSSYRRYAVDFDGDGKRDLWNHADAIGSIANYYRSYGWKTGEPVIVVIERQPETAGDAFGQLLERGLLPHATAAAVKQSGVTPAEPVDDGALVSVFGAESDDGMRYWMGFNNFYVITRYNRSINYALSVYELSQELRRAHFRAE